MVKALFDTNILIDYLNGIEAARHEIGLYDDRAISMITWMEVMVGARPGAGSPSGNPRYQGHADGPSRHSNSL